MHSFLPLLLTTAALFGAAAVFSRRKHTRRLDFSRTEPDDLIFPEHVRFGAATAAHQVEGGTFNNNWTRWETVVRPDGRPGIFTGEHCGSACDHWNRFEEDLERMVQLGLTMYRFSVEWSRIEPEEGRFDDAALERYRAWCVQLRQAGITPMVTLHHFTEPLWITDRGGFERSDAVTSFARFVAHVVPALADVVDHWVTVNEPVVYALLGWGRGEFPPGKREPQRMAEVLENLLLAHADAYHLVHELDGVDADGDGVSCMAAPAVNVVTFEPAAAWSPFDRYLSRYLDRLYNGAVLDALETGRLRLYGPGLMKLDRTHDRLAGTWDYVALNHYFRHLVGLRYLWRERTLIGFDPQAEKNDMGWDLTPQSLYDALHRVAPYRKPIYITENGICDGETPDRRRRTFLPQYLYAVEQALKDGLDVRAYLYWSLMDNFEWAHGFAPRFGLYAMDYDTQERTLTGGGELFQQVIAAQRTREADPRAGIKALAEKPRNQ